LGGLKKDKLSRRLESRKVRTFAGRPMPLDKKVTGMRARGPSTDGKKSLQRGWEKSTRERAAEPAKKRCFSREIKSVDKVSPGKVFNIGSG